MSIAVKSSQTDNHSSKSAHQGPFPPPYSSANRKCWEMRHSEDIHREFQPSSFVVLSCCILVCVSVCVGWMKRKGVFLKGITYHRSLFLLTCPLVEICPSWDKTTRLIHDQQCSKGHNGNKEAQSNMVMRLYFRAVDASVCGGELFSVVVRQKMSAWTGGRFSQASKEVLWLQYSVSSASDHLSRMDSVNFPQWSVIVYICITVQPNNYYLYGI